MNKFKKLSFRKKAGIITILALLIWYLFCLPSTLFDTPYSTLVSDQKGELLGARISEDGQWRFPPTDSLPSKYKTCVIQFEDRGFQYHPGVNPFSIARAFVQNIKARKIVSGGSTITMQTVRLMRNEKRTYFEKSIELIWATRLELTYSKNSILALYASHAPMGGNVVGIDAASWRYFGHDATSLSWAEAATLA
ncbi:MAG: transglycosylase domain-containing protein, partial [Dysgonamonadaceae bacterium]